MQLVMNLVLMAQLIAAIAMIGLVLVQHGKGADMGASFGGGASGSLFGATGNANFLSRTTAVCATIFFVATLTLSYFGNAKSTGSGSSVLDRAAVSASAPAPVPAASVAAQIPTAAAPAASAAASQ
ncbi:MAG: preprotein translocase subunit SecG [Leptothrix sp. (in: b-proteobacteria)]